MVHWAAFSMKKGVGENSTSLKRVRQQVFISSCWAETVYSQTVSLPPPHSSNCLGDSLRLEMKRTLFASVVEVRFGVWNTNKSANQPLRWDVDTNSEERGWTFCPASISIVLSFQDIQSWYIYSWQYRYDLPDAIVFLLLDFLNPIEPRKLWRSTG